MKTYYLKENEYIVAKFELLDENRFEGNAYDCVQWCFENGDYSKPIPDKWNFHSKVYAKWDGCSHWYFCGEDYNPKEKNTEDSYYHICSSFESFIITMCFIWKLAGDYHIKHSSDLLREDIEEEYNLKVVNDMLQGFEIIEE